MNTAWESELASFLTDLSAVQDESLEILARKRKLLVEADLAGLAEIAQREQAVIERLQGFVERRQNLLERAGEEGLPATSILSLAGALPAAEKRQLAEQLQEAAGRARLLRHHALSNWVLVQRTLIHLSQLLEIIATGGQLQPTYGKEQSGSARGALVDRAA